MSPALNSLNLPSLIRGASPLDQKHPQASAFPAAPRAPWFAFSAAPFESLADSYPQKREAGARNRAD
jgi:hypothetical protein